jgi:hypothetical protein
MNAKRRRRRRYRTEARARRWVRQKLGKAIRNKPWGRHLIWGTKDREVTWSELFALPPGFREAVSAEIGRQLVRASKGLA